MRRHRLPQISTAHTKREEGVALIVALMAVLVLSVLGTSLLFTTNTEDLVSHNYAAEVDALFAANSGLQIGIRNAMSDAIWDPEGQWGNHILAIGKTAPSGSTSTVVADGCSSAYPCLDTYGAVTGSAGSWLYDLKWFQGARCSSARCTQAEWDSLADEPYNLPALPWVEPPPGAYLPNGGKYRLFYQSVPYGTTEPPSGFRPDQIRILSIGQSGTAITGASDNYVSGTTSGAVERRSTRQVHATYRVRDIGIWSNASFTATTAGKAITGNMDIRGSLHITDGTPGSTVIDLRGNAGVLNNYTGMDAVLFAHIQPPGGNPHTLESEIRIKAGNVSMKGKTCFGQSADQAGGPAPTPGKGTIDGIYAPPATSIPCWHADLRDDYDASGFPGLWVPDYAAAYNDGPEQHVPPQHAFASYAEFLKGKASGPGVHALNLTGIGGALTVNNSNALKNAITLGTAAIFGDNTNDMPGGPPYMTVPGTMANGVPDTNLDILANGASDTIVGVFKHIPSSLLNAASSCVMNGGGSHGFVWLPAGTSVAGNPARSAEIWDFIQRNLAPYDNQYECNSGNGYNCPDLKLFLGKAALDAAPRTSNIGNAPVGTGFNNSYGRLLIAGVVYMENNIHLDGNFCYMGRGTFAAGPGNANYDVTGWLGNNDHQIAFRTFPCVDALGIMAPRDAIMDGNGQGKWVSYAMFGNRNAVLNHNMELAGTMVAYNGSTGAQQGNAGIDQVPDLVHCLPPFEIGDWHFYVTRSMSWSEH